MTSREMPDEEPIHLSKIIDRELTPEEKQSREYVDDVIDLVDGSMDLVAELKSHPLPARENRNNYTFSGPQLDDIVLPGYVDILTIDHTLDEVIVDYDIEGDDSPTINLDYIFKKDGRIHRLHVARPIPAPLIEGDVPRTEEFFYPNGERLALPLLESADVYDSLSSLGPALDIHALSHFEQLVHSPATYDNVSSLLEDRATTSSNEAVYDCTIADDALPMRVEYVTIDGKDISIMLRGVVVPDFVEFEYSETVNIEIRFEQGINVVFSRGTLGGQREDQEFNPTHDDYEMMIEMVTAHKNSLKPTEPELLSATDDIPDDTNSL